MAISVSYSLISDGSTAACAASNALSVTPNTGDVNFCTATTFTGAGIATLATNSYYFIYNQQYLRSFKHEKW